MDDPFEQGADRLARADQELHRGQLGAAYMLFEFAPVIGEETGPFDILGEEAQGQLALHLLDADLQVAEPFQPQVQLAALVGRFVPLPVRVMAPVRVDQQVALVEEGEGQGQKKERLPGQADLQELEEFNGTDQLVGLGRPALARRQLLAEFDALEAAVGAQALQPSGRLRINAPVSYGIARLAPLLPGYAGCHPQVELDLSLSDRQVDMVEEGFDLAVRIARLQSAETNAPYDNAWIDIFGILAEKKMRTTKRGDLLALLTVEDQGNAHRNLSSRSGEAKGLHGQ